MKIWRLIEFFFQNRANLVHFFHGKSFLWVEIIFFSQGFCENSSVKETLGLTLESHLWVDSRVWAIVSTSHLQSSSHSQSPNFKVSFLLKTSFHETRFPLLIAVIFAHNHITITSKLYLSRIDQMQGLWYVWRLWLITNEHWSLIFKGMCSQSS
jgi:hypothetical protein